MLQVTNTCIFCKKKHHRRIFYPAVVFAKGGDRDEQDWLGDGLVSAQNDSPLIYLE